MNKVYEINALIKDIKINKNTAFEKIVEEYSNSIIRLCYLQSGNRDESEDLAQDVFIKIYKNINKFKGDSSIYTWIYRITINVCLTYLKKKNKYMYEELDDKYISNTNVENEVVNNFSREILRKSLFETPQNYRIPLYMYYFENLKVSEIAEILEMNENTVKTRLRRGKDFIKNYCGGKIDE
ncbi:RNA polymerase sigma factor [Clostridium paraputrificum]|uniref:RNA polymerase sigma factor n=1 Tax=Clostridium TaxID=1485 RepID=UPI003D34A50D